MLSSASKVEVTSRKTKIKNKIIKGGPGEVQNIANSLIHMHFRMKGVSRNTVNYVVFSIYPSPKGLVIKW